MKRLSAIGAGLALLALLAGCANDFGPPPPLLPVRISVPPLPPPPPASSERDPTPSR